MEMERGELGEMCRSLEKVVWLVEGENEMGVIGEWGGSWAAL